MKSLRLTAPAKLNLSLKVEGKLSNGYHRIRSVIQPLSFGDSIELRITERPAEVTLEAEFSEKLRQHFSAWQPELDFDDWLLKFQSADNLACRAASAFLDKFSPERGAGVSIYLKKRIPLEAGLGGGSSDAAAVLLGLSRLYPKLANEADLLVLASELGSDVAALLFRAPSLVLGTGAQVLPLARDLSSFQSPWLVLLKPAAGVSTKSAYESLQKGPCQAEFPKSRAYAKEIVDEIQTLGLSLPDSPITDLDGGKELTFLWQDGIDGVLENTEKISWPYGGLVNDFQPVVRANFEEIDKAFCILEKAGAKSVVLAGSGSTVLGFFDGESPEILSELEEGLDASWFLESSEFALEERVN